MNVLFICSKNQWRSPTAERLYKNKNELHVRSAGTTSSAKRHVTTKDLQWADLILVMENKHLKRLRAAFPHEMKHKEHHILEIPDEYTYMHPELITLLQETIDPILEK